MHDILIAHIRGYLHGECITIPITEEVITLAQKHQVQNFLYMATQNSNMQKQFYGSVAQSMAQEYALDEMMQYFEEHELYMMPLKGICTKKRYSDSILRTMGDLDILCRPEQSKAVHLAMQALGYVYQCFHNVKKLLVIPAKIRSYPH